MDDLKERGHIGDKDGDKGGKGGRKAFVMAHEKPMGWDLPDREV